MGQSINLAGTALFFKMVLGHERLALPHAAVPDIRYVDWGAMRAAGIKACIFDKDNTLTLPYVLEVHPLLVESLQSCKAAFDGKVVLYSNSAGLTQFDPEGRQAATLEARLGVPVLRHKEKKPAGGCSELEEYFQCAASEMVMVGDRYFTDVAYGNRHGMLTVRVAPLTTAGEPFTVRVSRQVEERLVQWWTSRGSMAPDHPACTAPAFAQRFLKAPGIW